MFADLQAWLFESVVQPTLYALGWIGYAEWAFDATEWFLVGLGQIIVLAVIFLPAQRRWPVESQLDRRAVRVDLLYTLLHRLGGFTVLTYVLLQPLMFALQNRLTLWGLTPIQLNDLWQGFVDHPWLEFWAYVVIFDAVDYAIHRAQHGSEVWWSLHALHHSQRAMSIWTDNRNHLIDDVLRSVILSVVALVIGAAPSQFVMWVVLTQIVESLQHGNLRWAWPGALRYAVVSPIYHRRHHAIGLGHEGEHRGVNFAVLFPVWDVLFGTADFNTQAEATGIRDQLQGREYGQGFWSQQWLGLQRLWAALTLKDRHVSRDGLSP